MRIIFWSIKIYNFFGIFTKKTSDGLPIKAIAVESFRLFPPDNVPAVRSA